MNLKKNNRFLIARNCEDICCRKRTITKKSAPSSTSTTTSSSLDNYLSNYRQCEIHNFTNGNNVNDLRIKSMVQIFSVNFKQLICLGTLVHPKAVLTTLECVSM